MLDFQNNEKVYFDNGSIKVTDKRVVIEDTTHAIANIVTVAVKKQEPSGCFPGLLGISGAAFLFPVVVNIQYKNYAEAVAFLITATLLFVATFALMKNAKPTFRLIFSTAAGQMNVFSSQDDDLVKKIATAINDSMASR